MKKDIFVRVTAYAIICVAECMCVCVCVQSHMHAVMCSDTVSIENARERQ